MNKINEMPNYLTISIPYSQNSDKISKVNEEFDSKAISYKSNNMISSSKKRSYALSNLRNKEGVYSNLIFKGPTIEDNQSYKRGHYFFTHIHHVSAPKILPENRGKNFVLNRNVDYKIVDTIDLRKTMNYNIKNGNELAHSFQQFSVSDSSSPIYKDGIYLPQKGQVIYNCIMDNEKLVKPPKMFLSIYSPFKDNFNRLLENPNSFHRRPGLFSQLADAGIIPQKNPKIKEMQLNKEKQYLNAIDHLSENRKFRIIMKTNRSHNSHLSAKSSSLPNLTSQISNERIAETQQNNFNFSPLVSSQNDIQKQVYFSEEKSQDMDLNQVRFFNDRFNSRSNSLPEIDQFEEIIEKIDTTNQKSR